MSVITSETIQTTFDMADGLVQMAVNEVSSGLNQIAFDNLSVEDAQAAAHEVIYDTMVKYSEVGQVAGTELYDSLRDIAQARGYYNAVTMSDLSDAIAASARYAAYGDEDAVTNEEYDAYKQRAAETTARAALAGMRDSMIYNAVNENKVYGNTSSSKSGVRYARVVHPGATKHGPCAFCVMLASRGFVYATEESAGEFDRWHDDCACTVIPSWGEGGNYDGYEEYRDMYDNATSSLKSGQYTEKNVLSLLRSTYGLH